MLTGSFLLVYGLSFTGFVVLLGCNLKVMWNLFKKIPRSLIFFNLTILAYKLFWLPHTFSSRGSFGAGLLWRAKSIPLADSTQLGFVYSAVIKFFSFICHGIDFDFVVNLNIFLTFFSVFFIYLFIWLLFEDKIIAFFSSVFFAICPVVFIFSLTEDYTVLALFFSFFSLFLAAAFCRSPNKTGLFLLAAVASFLAIGARQEYIIFALIFLAFVAIFIAPVIKNKRFFHFGLVLYSIFLLPLFLMALRIFTRNAGSNDLLVHRYLIRGNYFFRDILVNHLKIFILNLEQNIKAISSFDTLMGFFLLLALVAVWRGWKEYGKPVGFFIFYFLIFFFYYAILHNEGLFNSYKYLASLVFPLAVLAAVGAKHIFSFYPQTTIIVVIIASVFSLYSVSLGPAGGFRFYHYFYPSSPVDAAAYKEYLLLKKEQNEFRATKNALFLSNGKNTLLFSAASVDNYKIKGLGREADFQQTLKAASSSTVIYVSQGIWGFGSRVDLLSNAISPEKFEELIRKYLNVEKEFFSFFADGHKIFLYKTSLK